ncbi:sec7 domain-containing protein [Cryptosporidium canis]|nr:sec7 domain-containing protein [Cryptosporidium canis]
MRNTELLENGWINCGDGNHLKHENDALFLKCIKNEIENIISALIRNNHHFSQIKYSKEIIFSFELPIVYQFQLILENIVTSNRFVIEECNLEPFFEVIQSPEYGGHATASVLNAIDVFIVSDAIVIEMSKEPVVINNIIKNILNCRFAASHMESDEIALQKLSCLLVNLIDSRFGEYISSENLIKCILRCFQISRQPRSSPLLRSLGEQAIKKIITIVFSRSDVFQKHETCVGGVSLIRIIHFLSVLSFAGLPNMNKNNMTSKFKTDELDDYIAKMIRKTIQMDGTDSTTYQELRKMGLGLLNIAIESGGKLLNACPKLVTVVTDSLCVDMLISAINEPSMLQIILKCMMGIFNNFRDYTKTQLEFCLTTIQLRLANGGDGPKNLLPTNIPEINVSLEQRESALNSLIEICKDSQFVVEIFQNYDCNLYCGDILKAIINTFVNQYNMENKHPIKKNINSRTFSIFQRLGLSGILYILEGITKSIKSRFDIEDNGVNIYSVNLEANLLRYRSTKEDISNLCDMFNSGSSSFLELVNSSSLFNSCPTPLDVAKIFRYCPKIDMIVLGEFLSKNKDWNGEVRAAYLSTFSFNKKSIVSALREVLATFKLPGESQQIERIMESFSHEYFIQQDPSDINENEQMRVNIKDVTRVIYYLDPVTNEEKKVLLDNSDTIFILSYSIIMLNTDLHNTQVKNKMSIDDFIKNNKGINNGKDLPRDFLINVFETIKNDEIKLSGLHISNKHNKGNQVDPCAWTNWVSKFFIERYPISLLDYSNTQSETTKTIIEKIFETILESGSLECILIAFENSNDIQILYKCINGILQIVYLCYLFSKSGYINEIIKRLSRYINLDFSAKCQLVLPVFIQISKLTMNTWSEESPWETIIETIFSLYSIQISSPKPCGCEELTDNRGRPMPNYSNIQFPKLCFFPRTKTFGVSHGFENIIEIIKKLNSSSENIRGPELNQTLVLDRNLHRIPLKLTKSTSPNNNNWLSDITNILFRSIEEEDEETSRFSLEPPNIVDSIVQMIAEEDIKYSDCQSIVPSEAILSWLLNGSSPYLSLSIYAIIQNSTGWERYMESFSNPIHISSNYLCLAGLRQPSVSGNSWDMLFHLVSNSLSLYDALIENLIKMDFADYSPLITHLKSCVDGFPFSDQICYSAELKSDLSISNTPQDQVSMRNNKSSEKDTYSDWSPLLIIDKNKILNFRRLSDPLCSIGILMSLLIEQVGGNLMVDISKSSNELSNQCTRDSVVTLEVFNFFLTNLKRYSIFNSSNKELVDVHADRKVVEISNDIPRSLSKSEFMFAERMITNSLLILIRFCECQDSELIEQVVLILEAILRLHPIVFSLHSERIVAVFQIIMRPDRNECESIKVKQTNAYLNSAFPTERCVLLMLGILQRMVYIPSVSVLENNSIISPEFYPGKLSDPQILILTSLECLGMWLYNPKYSSLLYNNISLIIQTLVTFAIFTPTSLNGNIVFTPIERDTVFEYNYDANLQAISLIFSLYSLFTNFENKTLISQVVHTLCIAASFSPNIVRSHTISRIQQTLGSQHISSSWYISDPWTWLDLIETSFIPLITFDFEFPYCYEIDRTSNDYTSALLAQQFKNKTAKYILGEDTVYKRQVQSVTIVSKIILARIDLLLVPVSIPCEHKRKSRFSSCDCNDSDKQFIFLIPVLINLINVLIKNSTGSSSVFFSETIKNILLVVLSTQITATYDELILNPIAYYDGINEYEVKNNLFKLLGESVETDITGIISSFIDTYIKLPMPDVASELSSILESLNNDVVKPQTSLEKS